MKNLEVHLHTNTTCNLYCIHCYNQSGKNILQDIPEADLLLETILYICNNYQAEIHLEGGEIFLRPDLLLKMNCLPNEVLKAITITTNGSIFYDTPEIVDMLKRIHALRISVEGHTSKQHTAIRRGSSLDKVLHIAEEYQKLTIPVCLRMTLNKLNYDHFMKDTILGLVDKGFHDFQVYEFQSVGRGIAHKDMLLLDSSLENLFKEMQNITMSGINLKMMFPARRESEIYHAKSRLESKGYQVSKIPSEAGISIHANGDVYRCAWDNHAENVLCNWYHDKNARQMLQTFDLTHVCDYCSAFRIVWSDF